MFAGNTIVSLGGSALWIQPFDVLGKPYNLGGNWKFCTRIWGKKLQCTKMHSQHDMIAHFLAYKRKNSEMALLFSVSANADFNAPSSHFNGDILMETLIF